MSDRPAAARTVIRRVRFKAGGEVHLLSRPTSEERTKAEHDIRQVLDMQADLVGFAFVAWGKDNASTACQWTGPNSCIPSILVCDFVRNRLLAMMIEKWTLDTVNGE